MSKVFKYKKIGGGSLTLKDGKVVEKNQIFTAEENQIPEAFRTSLEVLGEVTQPKMTVTKGGGKTSDKPQRTTPVKTTQVPEPPKEDETGTFEKVRREDETGYDVLDAEGNCINETPLTEEDADAFILSLG